MINDKFNNYIKYLSNKRILILGFAREGASILSFLRQYFPQQKIAIYDQKNFDDLDKEYQKILKSDSNLILFLGKSSSGLTHILKNFDLIIKSAGIPLKRTTLFHDNPDVRSHSTPDVEAYLHVGRKNQATAITTSTNIFFSLCSGKIIGVTGTKGKTTTSSLIYEILKAAGKKTVLLGNIGKPCLDYLEKIDKETWVVFELSSHQLQTLDKDPHIAVFLNIYPDHLDYFSNFNEYISAKANIAKFQAEKDFLVYNQNDKIVKKIAQESKAKKIAFNIPSFSRGSNSIQPPRLKVSLLGHFNQLNIAAAICVGKILNIKENIIKKAIASFKPIAHRLELAGTYKGITFYNDSQATIPQATIAALEALGEKVETFITGGSEKNLDYTKLAQRILKSCLKNLILFPPTGLKIWSLILKQNPKAKGIFKTYTTKTMKEAVNFAYKNTSRGKIVLLSPASTSFGLFKNYEDRGNQFKKYVREYILS